MKIFLTSLFCGCWLSLFAQPPALRIVYENTDAFNGYNESPAEQIYYDQIKGLKMPKGRERSSLLLYEQAGFYTIDSILFEAPGRYASSWYYSIVNVRDYANDKHYTIYPDIPPGEAFVEPCRLDGPWQVDRSQQKTILGMPVFLATNTALNGQMNLRIWFTDALPYHDGPFEATYGTGCALPGLVLEETHGDNFTTRAVDIQFIDPAPAAAAVKNLIPRSTKLKPTYSRGLPNVPGFIRFNDDSETGRWVPLDYARTPSPLSTRKK